MSTRRALVFSFIDRYSSTLVNIASSVFLSRLLTPGEIGVFSVTMVLLTFVSSLRDFGAGQYLVQERELTRERIQATWAVMLMTGMSAAALVLLLAHPVSGFYKDERIFDIMLLVSLNFAINPLGSLTFAWLSREMRFDALAVMRFVSTLAGALVSISLAWWGWGAISLALGSLTSTVVNAIVATFYRPADFPWWPARRGWRRVVSFGGKISANSLLNVAVGGSPELLLGKFQSLASAAMYSRANGLIAMFHRMVLDATSVVAYPMFSKEFRERQNINESFIQVISYVTALGWSFYIGVALMAHPAVRLLYGGQWDDAITVTRILAAAYLVGLPSVMCGPALMAVGGAGWVLKMTSVTLLPNLALIALGAYFSLNTLAVCAIGWNAVILVVSIRIAHRVLGFRWRMLARALTKSLSVAAVTAMAPASVVAIYGFTPAERAAPLILAGLGGLALFVAAVYALKHPLRQEMDRLLVGFRSRWTRRSA